MNMREILKGIIIGIAKIIPGLSGSVIMISFNLYDKAIDAITGFFDNPRRNFWFLFRLGLGVIIGITLFSNVLSYFIVNYYVYTTSLFIGLICGGFREIYKNVSGRKVDYVVMIICFGVMCFVSLLGGDNNYVMVQNFRDLVVFFVAGVLEAIGTVMPGISSTALLMLMGVYNLYLEVLSNVFNLEYLFSVLRFVIPFSMGMFFGIIVFCLIVNYLFKNYRSVSFAGILGVAGSSLVLLVMRTLLAMDSFWMFPFSVILFCIGYFITSII